MFNLLERPITFFDLETTGLDIHKDRITEISALTIHPNGEQQEYTSLINPLMEIPQRVIDLNGITNEMVSNKPTIDVVLRFMIPCFFRSDFDLAGYNILGFDLPLLIAEMNRTSLDYDLSGCKIVDLMDIYKRLNPRNLDAAYKQYTGKQRLNQHRSKQDTVDCVELFSAMLNKEDHLPRKVDLLHQTFAADKFSKLQLASEKPERLPK